MFDLAIGIKKCLYILIVFLLLMAYSFFDFIGAIVALFACIVVSVILIKNS